MAPISGKSALMSDERLPCSRGRTLNVSMALATLGLVIFLSASTCWAVSVTGASSLFRVNGRSGSRRVLDRALALLGDQALELLDDGFDLVEVRVDLEGALEVVEGTLRLVELQVDLPIAGQHPEMIGVALDDLRAVGEGLVVLADEEIDGGAL